MDVSIITVTYNSAEAIEEQIRSVRSAAAGLAYEQIVVDNASTDGTPERIATGFSGIHLITNTANLGFAAANNQASAAASGEFFLFLNPDMRLVGEGSLAAFVTWMRARPDVGIAGAKLVTSDGRINPNATPRRLPRVWDMVLVLSKLPHIFPRLLDRYLMRDFDPNQEQAVDSVRGSMLLVRRELVETLGWAFDPRYFIWFEDVDLCREAQRHGWKVMYTPIISCIDSVGQSFKKRNFFWKQKQFVTSMAKYFWKWRGRQSRQ